MLFENVVNIVSITYLLGINRIYEMKSTHAQIFEFIHGMGEATIKMEELTLAQLNQMDKSMFEAIEQGNVEFVDEVVLA